MRHFPGIPRTPGSPKVLAAALAIVVLAVTAVVSAQIYLPDAIRLAQAHNNHSIITHSIASDELNDGWGHSHKSQVKYIKHTNPFIADIEFVKYGGRSPDRLCHYSQRWKHFKTLWYRFYPNGWGIVAEEGSGPWLSSPSDHSLSYPWQAGGAVQIYTGAKVSNQLYYKEHHCLALKAVEYPGEKHWHFME